MKMTTSPFDQFQKRLFLCFGKTRDNFVLGNGLPIHFDEFLFLHLKARGYGPILFYSHHGLYFYDQSSRDWVIPPVGGTPASSQPAPKPRSPLPLAAGPGGLSLRKSASAAASKTATPSQSSADDRLCYPNMARFTEILGILRRLCHECKRGAVIFDGDHLPDFAQQGACVEQFRGFLEKDLRELGIDNRLLVIFVHGLEGPRLQEHFERNKPVLDILYRLDNQGRQLGLAQLLALSSPERDEVAALIDYYRLCRGLQVDWQHLARHITALTGYLKTQNQGIKDLEVQLDRLCNQSLKLDNNEVQNMTQASLSSLSAAQRLKQMVGMDDLKITLAKVIKRFENTKHPVSAQNSDRTDLSRLSQPHRPGAGRNLHIALTGNPGTGKTTVAKLIGEIYRDAGILETGHTVIVKRQDLVAGYVGQTALKTEEVIAQARGGVLFIDEAYSLTQGGENDFGREALTVLLEAMTALQNELVVIIAGYPNEIKELIDSNPGFDSRLNTKIHLPDMTPEQLHGVFLQQCRQHQPAIDLTQALSYALPDFFQELYDSRESNFGNARTVIEDVFQPTLDNYLGETTTAEPLDIRHFPERYQAFFTIGQQQKQPAPLEELNQLIGLASVKRQIQDLIDRLENDKARQESGIATDPIAPGHYLFAGNPGTGKTTVARLMAQQFKRMGLLTTTKCIERSATDLIGSYLGTTENAVRELLDQGLNGVVFIDEAHQLASEHGYGQNALMPFTAFMEKHKHEICIIFAGYSAPLERLLSLDPGFRRRFSRIEFEDFNAEELTEVFMMAADKKGYQVSPDLRPSLLTLFDWMVANKGEQFGNAGTAGQLLELAIGRLARRMQQLRAQGSQPTLAQRNTLLLSDIPPRNECDYLLGGD